MPGLFDFLELVCGQPPHDLRPLQGRQGDEVGLPEQGVQVRVARHGALIGFGLAERFAEYRERGPYYVSIGCAALGRPLKMVWRWQRREEIVWPITAFFPSARKRRR